MTDTNILCSKCCRPMRPLGDNGYYYCLDCSGIQEVIRLYVKAHAPSVDEAKAAMKSFGVSVGAVDTERGS